MIHIFGKYYARVDDYQIAIGVPYESTRKDGSVETILRDVRYYGTLENAVKGLYKRLTFDALQSVDGELSDAINALLTLKTSFSQEVDRILKVFSVFEDDGK